MGIIFYREKGGDCCLKCRANYQARKGSKVGNALLCNQCNDQEDKFLKDLYKSAKYKARKIVQPRKLMPTGITKDKIREIQEFVCDNYGILFDYKTEAYKYVNENFGTDLTKTEALAICEPHKLKVAGLKYKHKENPSFFYKR